MNFFKLLKKWAWLDIVILSSIIVADNVLKGNGMWVSVVLALITAVVSIGDEDRYAYDLPVNHPDQNLDQRDILHNLIRSILAVFLCVAPLAFASSWTQSAAVLAGLVSIYSVWVSSHLYFTTKKHVKYMG